MPHKTIDSRCTVLLDNLHRLRGDFAAPAQAAKTRLLKQLAQTPATRAAQLLRLHDELLFLAAYPDSQRIAHRARAGLRNFLRRVSQCTVREIAKLGDTGIAGTESSHTFMQGAVRWLVAHDEHVRPSWRKDKDAERLDPLIRLTLLPAEADAFESDTVTTRAWIEHASARTKGGTLAWLVGNAIGASAARELYDEAEVPVVWSIGDSPRAVTRNRAPVSRIIVRTAFRRPPPDPLTWIARPLAGVRRVTGNEAVQWIDASIAAIVARCREVVPTVYANRDEVYVADLGEGAELCVIGAHYDDRLSLEANYGYVMFSNGVPIGYGGVTPLADQANTGANLFEAFRGSEAPFLFGQSLRAFRALFGVSRFVVNPYQFGAGNDEALQSGAHWFYDRLGFRSVDPGTRALAARERDRLASHRGARSTVAMLRRLSRSDLVLELDSASPVSRFEEQWLAAVGRLVAQELSAIPTPSRGVHLTGVARRQARLFGGVRRPLTKAELRGVRLLSPVIALIEREASEWTLDSRRALWEIVRAKGGMQERRFARLARLHAPFWHALSRRCARAMAGGEL